MCHSRAVSRHGSPLPVLQRSGLAIIMGQRVKVGVRLQIKRPSIHRIVRSSGLVFMIVASPQVRCGSQMGLYKLERYGHKGYLIKVVVMALAGEVTQKLSPIQSWSNKNYKI